MRFKNLATLALFSVVAFSATYAVAFPFWLEAPPSTRPNPFDRQNPNFVPTLGTAPVSTITNTPQNTATRTITLTLTDTPAVTATPTSTVTPTFTQSAFVSSTPTNTQTATRTVTPTFTNSPAIVNTPTSTATAVVVMYDDMENPMCGGYGGYEDGTTSGFGDPVAETVVVHSGAGSWFQSFTTGTSWGCGWGFSSMGSCALVDWQANSPLPTYIYIWVKTDGPISLQFTFIEDVASIAGAVNSEHWSSPVVSLPGSSSWQVAEVKISDMVLANYFHVTLGNPVDNSIFDLAISEADIAYGVGTGALVNVYLDDFGFSNQAISTPMPTPLPGPAVVDDFENGLCGSYAYCDDLNCTDGNATDITAAVDTGTVHSGANSLYIQAKATTVSWGGGVGFGFQGCAVATLAANGVNNFDFWVKTDYPVRLIPTMGEGAGSDPVLGAGTGESWAYDQTIGVAGGAWQHIILPLASGWARTGGSNIGDGVVNTSNLIWFEWQIGTDAVGPETVANVYIDDITLQP